MQESRKLNLFSISMIVIGLVIGMGIFRTAKDAANAALTPSLYFAGWLVGGLVALCGALTYAEIGSRYPVTGGYYKIFSYAYHPSVAFALNCSILFSNAASVGGVALIGAAYIRQVVFPTSGNAVVVAIALAAIACFYLLNLLGLQMSARTQNVLMIVKLLMLVVILSSLFIPATYSPVNVPLLQPVPLGTSFSAVLQSFGLVLLAASFTYGGYQQTINFGSEVRSASRNLPRGIFIGITVIIVFYLLVNFTYYKVIGFDALKNSGEIASLVAGKLFGSTGAKAFSLLLFLSVLAYVNVSLLSNPRVMYAMAEDGAFPRIFTKKWERKDVYVVSLTVFAFASMFVVFFAETFDRILSFSIFLDSFGMATSAATIFLLRRKGVAAHPNDTYAMKLYPVMPLVFIAAYLFVSATIAINTPYIALTGTLVMLAFIGLYFIMRRLKHPPVNS